eukprot:3567270-Pyramimonas_sp.AAC.1
MRGSLLPRSAVSPVKYAVLSEVDAGYLDTGTATLQFILTCMRADYDLVLYVRDWAPIREHKIMAHLEVRR